jgi:hypothetical protein
VDFEADNRVRDRLLRRRLLNALYRAQNSPTGWIGAEALYEITNGNTTLEQFDGEGHAIVLMRGMERIGLAQIRTVDRRHGGSFSLKNLQLRISDGGVKLYEEAAPPHPMVKDDRIDAPALQGSRASVTAAELEELERSRASRAGRSTSATSGCRPAATRSRGRGGQLEAEVRRAGPRRSGSAGRRAGAGDQGGGEGRGVRGDVADAAVMQLTQVVFEQSARLEADGRDRPAGRPADDAVAGEPDRHEGAISKMLAAKFDREMKSGRRSGREGRRSRPTTSRRRGRRSSGYEQTAPTSSQRRRRPSKSGR